MGGSEGSALPAKCVAGWMYARWVCGAVTLNAWVMTPVRISSKRANPGRIGSPAASADVHPSGRKAELLRSHTAPDDACHAPLTTEALYNSYSLQLPCCTAST